MKGRLLLLILLVPCLTRADDPATPSAADHWARLERMVDTGVISPEGAKQEKARERFDAKNARKEAQRGLASVHPDLQPMQVKQLKIEPMILFLD